MAKKKRTKTDITTHDDRYGDVLASMVDLLESARRASARAVNSVMTATYWEIGRRIVELEQEGEGRAGYGELLLKQLAVDLTERFGRGFSWRNLYSMRRLFQAYPNILQTPFAIFRTVPVDSSGEILQTPSAKLQPPGITDLTVFQAIASRFPLPWSHYVELLAIDDENARRFYETEALRGGWSVRQLKRQVDSLFYERTLLSKNKAAMLRKGSESLAGDLVTPEEEIKDPLVLEFLGLKDEYSENDLENSLINKLEEFLLELGNDFTFVGRQRRLRIGDEWYRVDLLLFHRRLRCLVVIDLKIGKFDHGDAGQMHMYLNYASEHWTHEDENPPVGLILCARNDQAVARYALDGLPNKVLAAEYKLALPAEAELVAELEEAQKQFARRHTPPAKLPARIATTRTAPKGEKKAKKTRKKRSKAEK
jgi:predicted nuclease of restriction endonuclease-like (RecB) superfamily